MPYYSRPKEPLTTNYVMHSSHKYCLTLVSNCKNDMLLSGRSLGSDFGKSGVTVQSFNYNKM